MKTGELRGCTTPVPSSSSLEIAREAIEDVIESSLSLGGRCRRRPSSADDRLLACLGSGAVVAEVAAGRSFLLSLAVVRAPVLREIDIRHATDDGGSIDLDLADFAVLALSRLDRAGAGLDRFVSAKLGHVGAFVLSLVELIHGILLEFAELVLGLVGSVGGDAKLWWQFVRLGIDGRWLHDARVERTMMRLVGGR